MATIIDTRLASPQRPPSPKRYFKRRASSDTNTSIDDGRLASPPLPGLPPAVADSSSSAAASQRASPSTPSPRLCLPELTVRPAPDSSLLGSCPAGSVPPVPRSGQLEPLAPIAGFAHFASAAASTGSSTPEQYNAHDGVFERHSTGNLGRHGVGVEGAAAARFHASTPYSPQPQHAGDLPCPPNGGRSNLFKAAAWTAKVMTTFTEMASAKRRSSVAIMPTAAEAATVGHVVGETELLAAAKPAAYLATDLKLSHPQLLRQRLESPRVLTPIATSETLYGGSLKESSGPYGSNAYGRSAHGSSCSSNNGGAYGGSLKDLSDTSYHASAAAQEFEETFAKVLDQRRRMSHQVSSTAEYATAIQRLQGCSVHDGLPDGGVEPGGGTARRPSYQRFGSLEHRQVGQAGGTTTAGGTGETVLVAGSSSVPLPPLLRRPSRRDESSDSSLAVHHSWPLKDPHNNNNNTSDDDEDGPSRRRLPGTSGLAAEEGGSLGESRSWPMHPSGNAYAPAGVPPLPPPASSGASLAAGPPARMHTSSLRRLDVLREDSGGSMQA